jgi:hypothetical protein
MQALDNFVSPVLSFDGDITIQAVPALARSPNDEPMSDPSASAGASAIGLKTWVGKWKATTNPTPQKNEPAPKAPALTPPSGPR